MQLEDSSGLLLRDRFGLGSLQRLQQQRIEDRLRQLDLPDLRRPWPGWHLAASMVIAGLIVLASGWRPAASNAPAPTVDSVASSDSATHVPVKVLGSRVVVMAPAYAGIADREEAGLDVKALQGSRLRWSLRFDPQPDAVQLQYIDGDEIAMTRNGEAWDAELHLEQSVLYRIVTQPALAPGFDRLNRLDAVPDEAPQIHVSNPERSLSLREAGQDRWPLALVVDDDYGVAHVDLQITLVQGSGEQVAVSERKLRLRPESGGEPRHRSYRHVLGLSQLGLAAGDDLIVQVEASDNREPRANRARSASFILRWPKELDVETTGIDGLVQKVMPAYFRSQRQIIIDTEALIAQRAQLAADDFLGRSDAIGVDQKILRLRYGQFLGEEFESGARPESSAHGEDEDSHAKEATRQDALSGDHDHDKAPTRFGNEGDVVAQFGHTHDHSEAATLLDPQTKRLLKSALSEMWQAELHLRMGEAEKALPFENRALDFIKQVQQASRIYLARVGLELPPVDESRRLSGERKDVRDRPGVLATAESERAPVDRLYRELLAGHAADLDAFEEWLRANPRLVGDALGLRAGIDALRRQADCADCRTRLLDALWKELPVSPATTTLRERPDEQGRHYLDLLNPQESP
ncbi:MAG: hypothetical protein EYC71_06810 [Gammaproteobacteria bacterium]|nr:MAG: hypothetical protein EYC71_06810 [Gammaproteobacteria bacterium]